MLLFGHMHMHRSQILKSFQYLQPMHMHMLQLWTCDFNVRVFSMKTHTHCNHKSSAVTSKVQSQLTVTRSNEKTLASLRRPITGTRGRGTGYRQWILCGKLILFYRDRNTKWINTFRYGKLGLLRWNPSDSYIKVFEIVNYILFRIQLKCKCF